MGAIAFALTSLLALPSGIEVAAAESVRGDVRMSTDAGYGRIVFTLDEAVDAKVQLSGTILIVDFARPIDVMVDRLATMAPDYISAARRDPAGKTVRIALVRGFRVNPQTAGERLFVDLLPPDWQGVPPGLPQDVVEDLARRTREAERQLRQQRLFARQREQSMVPVKVGAQPTFTRYVFDLPNFATVVPERGEGRLTLNFDQPIKYDLADAKATMPKTLKSVSSEGDRDTVAVTFVFEGAPDVRLFREDRSVVVDIDNGGVSARKLTTENGVVESRGDVAIKAPASVTPPAAVEKGAPPAAAPETVTRPGDAPANSALAKPSVAEPSVAKPSAVKLSAADSAVVSPASAEGQKRPPAEPAVRQSGAPVESKAAPTSIAELAAQAVAVPPPPKVSTPDVTTPSAPGPQLSAAPSPVQDMARSQDMVPSQDTVRPQDKVRSQDTARPQDMARSDPAPSQAPPDTGPAGKPARQVAPAAETTPASPPPPPRQAERRDGVLTVSTERRGDDIAIHFPFGAPTPAAAFNRGENLWLVFDGVTRFDLSKLDDEARRVFSAVQVDYPPTGETVVRLKLDRPRVATLVPDGNAWTVAVGEGMKAAPAPLTLMRNLGGKGRTSVVVPFSDARQVHRLSDPDTGDKLLVVTALGPARGFAKAQNFIEFRTLTSAHGVVVQPIADDIAAEIAPDKIVLSRPNGLTLSSSAVAPAESQAGRATTFDPQTWGFDRSADFLPRQTSLIAAAAAAPEGKRREARLELARFYLARDLATEAKAVIDVVNQDDKSSLNDVGSAVMKAVAHVILDRPDEALKDLANASIGDQGEAPLWRAVALSKQGKWAAAHDGFKAAEDIVGTLPVQLQQYVMLAALRTAIEVHDLTAAAKIVSDIEMLGVSADNAPALAVLKGRLNEAAGNNQDAIDAYRTASNSPDRTSAAQGRLRELSLRHKIGEIKRTDMIAELETLTTTWRGDETETEGLQRLAHFYTEDGRYRDAFHVMRVALLAHANSDLTRKIQDEAVETFDSIFLGNKGDALPPIEALGLFYDYRDLTPVGRRGDEMIRRLADRLVAVDLLDQASELLDYQVTHRLQGAARAQVAARLATVYLMNRKPDRALATLRMTRISGLSNELRSQRLLLEARALSDIGRHDLALEVVANLKGDEVTRLRADIYWAAKRWREAAEQTELLLGERWKDFTPLSDVERGDVLRAALGYALADEAIGLAAFRDKYAAKVADGPAGKSFDVLTNGRNVNTPDFRDVAMAIASQDSLRAFLQALRARYPDSGGQPKPPVARQTPAAAESMASSKLDRQPDVSPPNTVEPQNDQAPAGSSIVPRGDPAPTGSISDATTSILPPQVPAGVRLNPAPMPSRAKAGAQNL